MVLRKKPEGPDAPPMPSVERWTVERLDRDAGAARVEVVPIKKEFLTGELLDTLRSKGLEPDMDRLSMWDTGRVRIRRMSVTSLARKLDLRPDEKAILSENMVFWLLRPRKDAKEIAAFHATQAARKTSKELYRKAAYGEGGRP